MTSTPETPPLAEAATPSAPEMSPAACAQQLKQLFPALFGGVAKPLKLRIQADIQERAPGVFTKPVLSAFLRRYTASHAYLVAITKAAQRFDLDGAPAGELSDEHRKVAQDELTRRRANTEARRTAEEASRALEDQQRHNRAHLLHDFERTTLTEANFCALKGVSAEELPGLLERARQEAQERPPQLDPREQRQRRPGGAPRRR
ncbi:MAG: ProQ/FinO family protein [Burkholderiales bacterium]|nr:ProQ/FinO family protein [Burkholderiales bacterium]